MSEANISESDLNGRYSSKGKEKVGKEGKKTQDGGRVHYRASQENTASGSSMVGRCRQIWIPCGNTFCLHSSSSSSFPSLVRISPKS